MRCYKLSIILLILVFGATDSSAQSIGDTSPSVLLYYKVNGFGINQDYLSNRQSLDRLREMFSLERSAVFPDSIELQIASSPDGAIHLNESLSHKRARQIQQNFSDLRHLLLNNRIKLRVVAEDWTRFEELAIADPYVTKNEALVQILKKETSPDEKEQVLKQFANGQYWSYFVSELLPLTRYARFTFHQPKKIKGSPFSISSAPSVSINPGESVSLPSIDVAEKSYKQRPHFALKTNLLFDAFSAINAEIEVPIGNRWSVSGELIFPWWKSDKENFTMQLLSGQGALKYWFGNRTAANVLEGWSLGITGGTGKYDLQIFDKDGEQGHFYNVGLQGGYAHRLGKNLKMEYAIGAGFMRMDYKSYDKVYGTEHGNIKVFRYPWIEKRRDWWGPFTAKVSLVWLIKYKSEDKKGALK